MDNGVNSQTAASQSSHHGFAARALTALTVQPTSAGQDTSALPVERALTNAQRLRMKLARASLAAEDNSEENKAVNQAPIPLNSDAAQWPTLGESRLMGKKGKTKKSIKQGLKLGDTPGPEPYQGPNPGSGSGIPTGVCANPEDNSYFASTGSAPLAKDKDGLAKLFDKYRG